MIIFLLNTAFINYNKTKAEKPYSPKNRAISRHFKINTFDDHFILKA